MTTLREATMNDLLKFNNVNLDVLTETYNMQFYYHYMSRWPEAFMVAEGPGSNGDGSSEIMGYVLGKAEGEGKLWHGHVSAVTVAPSYRRLGLAKTLMDDFEDLCVNTYDAFFVDLFVRETNNLAQEMYVVMPLLIILRACEPIAFHQPFNQYSHHQIQPLSCNTDI